MHLKAKNISKLLILFVTILVFNPNFVFSQIISVPEFENDYVPCYGYKKDSIAMRKIIERFENRSSKLKEGQTRKTIEVVDELNGNVINIMKQLDSLDLVMYNDTLSRYLQGLLQKIISKNPCLKNQTYDLFTKRSGIPNAADWGEGILLVNLDILSKQTMESQLVFVICHELAHDFNKDVFTKMKETVSLITDKELNKNIKKISKQEYNTFKAMDDLFYKITSNRNSYSRKKELEADSLGFIFYKNTGYDPKEVPGTLLMLDSLDNPLFKKKIDFQKHFSFPDLIFNNALLYEDTTDLNWQGNLNYVIPDSMKTHPDCKIRAENIQKIISALPINNNNIYNSKINYINSLSFFELIQHYATIDYYSLALYYTISLQEVYPNNIYLKCMVVDCLYGISEAIRNHTFSKSVDLPSNEGIEVYNELLRFLNNATFAELDKLSRKYFQENITIYSTNNCYAGYLNVLFKYRDTNYPANPDNLIQDYKTKFPSSVYTKRLNDKLKLPKP